MIASDRQQRAGHRRRAQTDRFRRSLISMSSTNAPSSWTSGLGAGGLVTEPVSLAAMAAGEADRIERVSRTRRETWEGAWLSEPARAAASAALPAAPAAAAGGGGEVAAWAGSSHRLRDMAVDGERGKRRKEGVVVVVRHVDARFSLFVFCLLRGGCRPRVVLHITTSTVTTTTISCHRPRHHAASLQATRPRWRVEDCPVRASVIASSWVLLTPLHRLLPAACQPHPDRPCPLPSSLACSHRSPTSVSADFSRRPHAE